MLFRIRASNILQRPPFLFSNTVELGIYEWEVYSRPYKNMDIFVELRLSQKKGEYLQRVLNKLSAYKYRRDCYRTFRSRKSVL